MIVDNMRVNKKGEFIGKGEDTCLIILKDLFENAEFKTQVPLKNLLAEEWIDTLTERQEKETIDIVILKDDKKIAVRVQDKRHKGFHLAQRDLVQKKTLEWNNCIVVDLDEQECPTLFKEILDVDSIKEVKSAFSLLSI
jgi:hypothetical protein